MKFLPRKTYRHSSCLDLDIEVLHIVVEAPSMTVMKVLWMNRNWSNGEFVVHAENIKVLTGQYKFWSEV